MDVNLLKPKQVVRTESGVPCEIEQFLGGGGQGEVYRAKMGGSRFALKWYYPNTATVDQRSALEALIKKGPPSNKFLWPMELASQQGVAGFGYIMPLRDSHYKNIVDLMKRRIEPTFRALCTTAFELADNYFQLHAQGLAYRDISFGNVFFDPNNGSVLICDNDNVTVDKKAKGGVQGTPRFMAPEIVAGKAYPSTQTDLFSLAVLLFYMFMIHHPLEGAQEASIKCFDLPAMKKLYGEEPVFIWDPEDVSNRPVPGYQDNAIIFWKIYPEFIKELFIQSFTTGIRDPLNGRVAETVWRTNMVRLRDLIYQCAHCGAENFHDETAMVAKCWSCGKNIKPSIWMKIGKQAVMLNSDTKLYPHHIDGSISKLFDFSQPAAEINQHPQNPKIWGLKNLTAKKWVVTTKDGSIKDVEPDRSVQLALGTKVQFGNCEGEFCN